MRGLIVSEFGPPSTLHLGKTPNPSLGPNEVLVKIHATSINYVDLLVISGKYQFLPERPFIPGKLPAGIVIKAGHAVDKIKIGQHVLTMAEQGGFGERIAVSEQQCFLLPDNIPFADAAAFSVAYDTAWFALHERARFKKDDVILVLGATGNVGYAAIQLAKARGARKILAGVSSLNKTDYVLSAGADHVIEILTSDIHNSLRDQVYSANEGQGADIILDPLGGDVFDAAIRALTWRGRLVVIGFAAGRIPNLKVNYLLLKNIEVSGLQVSDFRKRDMKQMQTCFQELFALFEAGKIKLPAMSKYSLDEHQQAFEELSDRSSKNRVVFLQ